MFFSTPQEPVNSSAYHGARPDPGPSTGNLLVNAGLGPPSGTARSSSPPTTNRTLPNNEDDRRSSSIAALRQKAQEHTARLTLNNNLSIHPPSGETIHHHPHHIPPHF